MDYKLRFNFTYLILLLLLSVVFFESSDDNLVANGKKEKNPLVPSIKYPDFYVEEDVFFVIESGDIIIVNCSNAFNFEILGKLSREVDSSRTILEKCGDILIVIREQSVREEGQLYLYSYLEMINVSDFSNPSLIGAVELAVSAYYNHFLYSIDSYGCYTDSDTIYYFVGTTEIFCIEYTIGGIPTLIEDYQFDNGEVLTHWEEMNLFEIIDNYIIFGTENEFSEKGFVVYSFTNYHSFVQESEWFGDLEIPGITEIHSSFNNLYLRNGKLKTEIFSLDDIENPVKLGYLDISNLGYQFCCRESYVFISDGLNLGIYNWSQPNDLTLLDYITYENDEDNWGYFDYYNLVENKVSENRIYLPAMILYEGGHTLYILDWSDPSNLYTITKTSWSNYDENTGNINTMPITSTLLLITCLAMTIRIIGSKKNLRSKLK